MHEIFISRLKLYTIWNPEPVESSGLEERETVQDDGLGDRLFVKRLLPSLV